MMDDLFPVIVEDGGELHVVAFCKAGKKRKTEKKDSHTGPRKDRPRRHSRGYGLYHPKRSLHWKPKIVD